MNGMTAYRRGSMALRTRALVAGLLALAAWSGGALAAGGDWQSSIDWRATKDRGTAALEQSHFAQALSLYREAVLIQQRAHRAERAVLAFNIALTHLRSGRIDLAWQRFSRLTDQLDHPAVARAALAEIEKLREKHEALPRLSVDCESGIEMRVAAAEGQVLTAGPDGWVACGGAGNAWSERVRPGDYIIRVRAGSHRGAFELNMAGTDQHHHVYIPPTTGGAMCAGSPRG